jgi:type II secretory pathway pseudopilin PulG
MSTLKERDYGFTTIEGIILIIICLVIFFVLLLAYISAQSSVRDAQRVSDANQLQRALRLYYQEYGRFPEASNYVAVGVDNSFSRFVSKWPISPKPADGDCPDDYNVYAYEELNDGEQYQLLFCLGESTDRYRAGINVVNQDTLK